jgi:hypothetical protein
MVSAVAGDATEATPLQRLVDAVLARTDVIADRTVERMQAALPSYAQLSREALRPIVIGNVHNILLAVRDPAMASKTDPEQYRETGERRARQGISSDEMQHGWRIGLTAAREEAYTVAGELGISSEVVLQFVERMIQSADGAMLASTAAHRQAEFEMARREEHHRANLVRGILFGTMAPPSARVEAVTYGLDPDRQYCAIRARPSDDTLVRTLELELGVAAGAGPRRGLAALLDGDLAGFVLPPITGDIPVPLGVGPPARLHELENSFRLATRVLECVAAMGTTGPTNIAELGLWPAVLADRDVADEVIRRVVQPLLAQGKTGTAILETVSCYLSNDLRLEATAEEMFFHVNTVRYRLRRFEELTGLSLRSVADVVQVWWALERLRLSPPGSDL